MADIAAAVCRGLEARGWKVQALETAWVDVDDLRAKAREVGENRPEFVFFQALFAASFQELGEGLALLGAVEYEPGDGVDSAEENLRTLLNAMVE